MTKRKTKPPVQADTLGVRPCGCDKHCGTVDVNLYDADGNVIAFAIMSRSDAIDIASTLMDLVEAADRAVFRSVRRAPGETLQ